MRKSMALALVIAALLLSGCAELRLEMVDKSGNIGDMYSNDHLEMSTEYDNGQLYLKVRNLTEETIMLAWLKDGLSLPDGSLMTLGHISSVSLNQYDYEHLKKTFQKESGIESLSVVYIPAEYVKGPLFIDDSPSRIGPSQTAEFCMVAVKDPEDFAAPQRMTFSGGGRFILFGTKLFGMGREDRISWRFSYRLVESGLEYEDEISLQKGGK